MTEADAVAAYEIALKVLSETPVEDQDAHRAALREAWFAYDGLSDSQQRRIPNPDGAFASRPNVALLTRWPDAETF